MLSHLKYRTLQKDCSWTAEEPTFNFWQCSTFFSFMSSGALPSLYRVNTWVSSSPLRWRGEGILWIGALSLPCTSPRTCNEWDGKCSPPCSCKGLDKPSHDAKIHVDEEIREKVLWFVSLSLPSKVHLKDDLGTYGFSIKRCWYVEVTHFTWAGRWSWSLTSI